MNSGLYAFAGDSATATAAACANRLDEPMTNVSNVYLGLSRFPLVSVAIWPLDGRRSSRPVPATGERGGTLSTPRSPADRTPISVARAAAAALTAEFHGSSEASPTGRSNSRSLPSRAGGMPGAAPADTPADPPEVP